MIAATVAACGAPRDPDGTSVRIDRGVLRVGVSENPPWVRLDGVEPRGLEPDLVRQFAQTRHARVEWVRRGESRLLPALEKHGFDLTLGGVTSTSPWVGKLGTTRPYVMNGGQKHVWLAAPGENRLLLDLDRFLQARRAQA